MFPADGSVLSVTLKKRRRQVTAKHDGKVKSSKCPSPVWFLPAGLLSQCLQNLLFDPQVCLGSLEEDVAIEVSIQEERVELIYRGLLLQEGQ